MNCINVSQKNNLVIIKIHSEASFTDIISQIRKKVIQLSKIYKDEKTPILITGKVLKNKEMDKIEEIIKGKLDVDIDFDMPKELGLSNIKKTFVQEVSNSETKFHRGSIRSGQRIEEEGSVVILGDVNSGAEVIAADNIVVLGTLRGLAHAGAKGNRKAIIAAGKLDTVQIRIANVVKEINRDEEPLHREAYIFIDEDEKQIIIE
ncbi:MAG: septum site-determining protein MinC [Clostridia bacterium]|nr:septum site-determining protein MinC [Clostridia bacterium]